MSRETRRTARKDDSEYRIHVLYPLVESMAPKSEAKTVQETVQETEAKTVQDTEEKTVQETQ